MYRVAEKVGDAITIDFEHEEVPESDGVQETFRDEDFAREALQLNDAVEERVADPREGEYDGDREIELLREVE